MDWTPLIGNPHICLLTVYNSFYIELCVCYVFVRLKRVQCTQQT